MNIIDCIRKVDKSEEHIYMSSNAIHGADNPQNYVEMVKSIKEFGRYPLSL